MKYLILCLFLCVAAPAWAQQPSFYDIAKQALWSLDDYRTKQLEIDSSDVPTDVKRSLLYDIADKVASAQNMWRRAIEDTDATIPQTRESGTAVMLDMAYSSYIMYLRCRADLNVKCSAKARQEQLDEYEDYVASARADLE